MDKVLVVNAIIEVMTTDDAVVKVFAERVSKKLSEGNKVAVRDFESTLIVKHIVFAEEGEEGTFMTVKDIAEAINEFDPTPIKPRVFGKFLKDESILNKTSNKGHVYFIEGIYEDKTEPTSNALVNESDSEEEEETGPGIGNKAEDLAEELRILSKKELKSLIKEKGLSIDTKGKETFDIVDELLAILCSEPVIEEVTEDAAESLKGEDQKVNSADLLVVSEVLDDYETEKDYRESLSSMSRSKLIKHINAFRMKVVTVIGSGEKAVSLTNEQIISNILGFLDLNGVVWLTVEAPAEGGGAEVIEDLEKREESPEEPATAEKPKKDKSKKDKSKKDKKKGKKKKK